MWWDKIYIESGAMLANFERRSGLQVISAGYAFFQGETRCEMQGGVAKLVFRVWNSLKKRSDDRLKKEQRNPNRARRKTDALKNRRAEKGRKPGFNREKTRNSAKFKRQGSVPLFQRFASFPAISRFIKSR